MTGIRVNVPLFGNSTSGLFVKYKMAAKSFPKVIFLYRSKNKTTYQSSLSMHVKFQIHIFRNNRVIGLASLNSRNWKLKTSDYSVNTGAIVSQPVFLEGKLIFASFCIILTRARAFGVVWRQGKS